MEMPNAPSTQIKLDQFQLVQPDGGNTSTSSLDPCPLQVLKSEREMTLEWVTYIINAYL